MKVKSDIVTPFIIAIVMICAFSYFSSGYTLIITFVPGVLAALLFYFLTFYKKQAEPQNILPLYLLALGVQFIHFAEEFVGGFNHKFPALFNSPEYPINLFVLFNMFAYCAFLMGGIMIYKKKTTMMIVPLFFVVYGTIGNAIAHVIFAIMVNGYFPGLYTALVYWIIGPVLIHRIWNETR